MKLPVLVLAVTVAASVSAAELPAALRAAIAADPTLASATAMRDAAHENIAIARARLLPQVSFQSTVQHLDQTTRQAGGEREFSGLARSTQLSLRQAIYRPKDRAGLEIGRLQAEYGQLRLLSAEADLWSRTSIAWLDVLAAQAVRDVHERAQRSIEVAAEQERKRYAAGDSTRDAVAEADAQHALARAQLLEARIELDARLQAFNLLTRQGVPDFNGYRLPEVLGVAWLTESREVLLERMLATNPEVAAARVNEEIAKKRLAQASADHLPSLDMVGSMADAQNDTTNTLGLRYRNTMVGMQVVVPIYAGGGVNAAQRQAAAALQASSADTEGIIQKLSTQFALNWSAQGGLVERLRGAQELVRATQEQRRAAEFGIRAGSRTWADLGAADLAISRRESEVVQASATLLKSVAQLLALLPASDPSWERWTVLVSNNARR